MLIQLLEKGSPVHVAPACAGSGKGPTTLGLMYTTFFYKGLFPGLDPMTSWSQGNSFTAVPVLPFIQLLEL
jgi:hypothetical protein